MTCGSRLSSRSKRKFGFHISAVKSLWECIAYAASKLALRREEPLRNIFQPQYYKGPLTDPCGSPASSITSLEDMNIGLVLDSDQFELFSGFFVRIEIQITTHPPLPWL